MKKNILYRLFGLGGIPGKLRPILEQEGVVIQDEGMSGRFITRNVKGPGKHYIRRSEGFSGCLAITKKRIVCYTFWKRQINISLDDSRVSKLFVKASDKQELSISFEASDFREGWEGVIEFRFNTGKTLQFQNALISLGAQQGTVSIEEY